MQRSLPMGQPSVVLPILKGVLLDNMPLTLLLQDEKTARHQMVEMMATPLSAATAGGAA